MTVRWIPAGRVQKGSNAPKSDRDGVEGQQEAVLDSGFFMAETECTQTQWSVLMESNPSILKESDLPAVFFETVPAGLPRKRSNLPVGNMKWAEARKFCRKLTKTHREQGVLPEGWQ
ncbi:MAG: hypothetical protein EXS30_10170 [Pedosphaera sp.]|nr:hypothetical protein [Pedosphaera sp.]